MSDEKVSLLRALMSPAGTELLAQATEARSAGRELPAGERLRRDHDPGLVAAAFAQAELRERARHKFGMAAATMWLTRDGLEQASGAAAAAHRAARLVPAGTGRIADLCCGIGGDLMAIVRMGNPAIAVDLDPVHLLCAQANAEQAGGALETRCEDVRITKLTGIAAVTIDPARRSSGRRLATGDSEPPLSWCAGIPVQRVAVKAAPGLDPHVAPAGWQLEFVAEGRDLKETVLWSPTVRDSAERALATVLTPHGAVSLADDGGGPAEVLAPGRWLLDCNPAVGRAGAVDALARQVGGTKIDDRIAFLTADRPMHSDFGRLMRIERELPFDLRRIARLLRSLDVGAADLRRRGLAGDVDLMRNKLRLKGSRRVTLVLTRARDRPWALVCVEPDDPPL